jgi:hypothetical protein
MIELIHSGLRNDSDMETFSLKHKANGVVRFSFFDMSHFRVFTSKFHPCLHGAQTLILAYGM